MTDKGRELGPIVRTMREMEYALRLTRQHSRFLATLRRSAENFLKYTPEANMRLTSLDLVMW